MARVSGDAPPQPLATSVTARLARRTQTVRGRTMAWGGETGGPCGAVRTMRSRMDAPGLLAMLAPSSPAPGANPATFAHRPVDPAHSRSSRGRRGAIWREILLDLDATERTRRRHESVVSSDG